ncbi:MAG TPA: class I adenylate-forming enzyme family protein [Burkholderiales bacterium]|nr:class I adenylate-forming enzyme family protein [Burkholderiales bacterium]
MPLTLPDRSPGAGATHWNDDTVWSLVERTARVAPGAPMLLAADSTTSYGAFRERALRIAAGFAALGVRKGDVVAVQLPNVPEYLLCYAALCALGAVLQPVHMPYRRAELAALLRHSGAGVFAGLAQFKEEAPVREALALRAELPGLRAVVSVGGQVEGADTFESLEAGSAPPSLPAVGAGDAFLLLYTSGTTDNPKGVPLAYRGFLANARLSVPELEVGRQDILLSAAPLTHLYGLFVFHLALHAGAAMSLLPAFSPPALAQTLERHRATAVFAGPAHFKPMLDTGLLERHDLSSVRFVCLSGSTVPPELAAAVEEKLRRQGSGCALQLWGMSELQAGAYGRPRDPVAARHRTSGAASPGTELRIVDDLGAVQPAGTSGRLQMRGASLFSGYLGNERATREAFAAGGWFDTGDTAILDEAGRLRLTGRVKEIINRGGVKYSPVDIEPIIERVPGIERAAIVPFPDAVLGERACVFVQPQPGAKVELAAITRALDAAGIAKFKWPERLELIAAMPLTPTQKIMRGRLRRRLEEPAGQ